MADQQHHPPQADRPAVAVLLSQDLRLHRGQSRPQRFRRRPEGAPRRQDRRPVAARLPPVARCPQVAGPTIKDADKRIIPVGIRDRAMLAVLGYSACRVGELVKLRVRDFRTNGEHRVLNITGKGNKERTTPLHLEAVERLAAWLALPGIADDPAAALFRPQKSVRGNGKDGFRPKPMTTRAVEKLIEPLRQSPEARRQRHRPFAPRHGAHHR